MRFSVWPNAAGPWEDLLDISKHAEAAPLMDEKQRILRACTAPFPGLFFGRGVRIARNPILPG